FNSRDFRGKARLIDRTDPGVNFDFGTAGPELAEDAKEKFDPHQFSIRWDGSVLAPETGSYEFVVRTEHAVRLWVNDHKKPPDDRSLGWERGTTISKEWEAAATDAALETAAYVAARLPELAGVPDGAKDRGPKLREFCRRFAERAFRRPLSDDEKQLFIDRQ